MSILKVTSPKSSVPLVRFIRIVQFCTTLIENSKLKPINMSYASYESTEAVDSADPLIVMHGLFGSKANWNTICKVLHRKTVPRRKIIAVDARNHGDSPHSKAHSYPHMAEDMKTLINKLGFKKAALMGHSMGGRSVMYLALTNPELVDKLIVADMSPVTNSKNFDSMRSIFTALQKITLSKNMPMSIARRTADAQLSQSVDDKGVRSFMLTNLVQKQDGSYTWRINIPAIIANYADHLVPFPEVPNMQFSGPVLFIAGGHSDFIQKRDHPHILKLFPKAEFKEIDGAGHWLHSEKPAEFLKICLEFLNRKIK